ncbi:MAG: T9SS type A sorting domain-containing protein [Bacteroidota bacterium]
MRLLRFIASVALVASSLAFGQAANDECATATVISSLPFTANQNTRLASVNLADPKFNCNDTAGLGKTVWFKYVATADTGVIFSTIGSLPTADYDIMLGLFSGSCGSLTFVDCSDDANGTRQSELYYKVKSGTTYYILVGEWANGGTNGGTPTGGDLVFNVKIGKPPVLAQGPKAGSVATGTLVSISSMPNSLPKMDGNGSISPNLIENREIEVEELEGPLKSFRGVKSNNHQVNATGPIGSNYYEDGTGATAAIGRPVITKSFLGIPLTNSIPPDPIMAVGPQHVVIMVNTSFRIFDKSGTLLKTVTAQNFYNSIAPGTGPNDPQIVYDHYAKRFIMMWMTSPTDVDHRHLIAVSKDSSAMGDWYMWNTSAVNVGDSSTGSWGDYPALSYDQNAVYLTSNQFSLPLATSAFKYTKLRILDKSKLVANTGGPITFQDFWEFKDPQTLTSPGNIRPMNGYSSSKNSYMMNVANTSPANYMTLWTISDPASATPSVSAKNISVVQYSSPGNANQLGGGSPLIESGSNRIRANIIYRDSMLWAVHSVANGSYSGVHYVKVNPYTSTTVEDAVLGQTGYWHFYPAIMVDENQNMLMTYSRSGSNEFAGAFVAGRKKNDPPGISSSVPMREGLGNYVLTYGGTRNRWGDYSGISLDPSDQSVMWTHTEYASASNVWSTWISKNKIGPIPGTFATLSKGSLNFGTKQVNQASDTLEVTVTNDGLDSLAVTSISATSANYLVYGKPATPSKLPSQGVITLKIVFKPTVGGPLNDSIVIVTNDPANPTQTVKLSGSGFKITLSQQGTIYASSGATDGSKLYGVNSYNGTAAAIGAIGLPNIASLRVHPTTKELIGFDPTGTATGGSFYRISSDVSNTQLIASTTISNMKGLAFENDSMVFMGAFNGSVYRVNYKTGVATLLGTNSGVRPAGFAINPVNGTLWMSTRSSGGTSDAIYKVNKTTGIATKVGNAGTGTDVMDIVFDKNGKLYGLGNTGTNVNNLLQIDTTTGTAFVKGPLGRSNVLAIALNPDAVAAVGNTNSSALPTEFEVYQNYPNPFNPMTTIRFSVPTTVKVVLRVYDAIGREVSTLADGYREPGFYTEYFDGSKLASGVYYYKLTAGSFSEIKKMLLVK